MSDIPTFSDDGDEEDSTVTRQARDLIPWLPDPPTCEECGAMRYASETFDPREAVYVASWECRVCDAGDVYRDPAYGDRVVDGPREGSSAVARAVELLRR